MLGNMMIFGCLGLRISHNYYSIGGMGVILGRFSLLFSFFFYSSLNVVEEGCVNQKNLKEGGVVMDSYGYILGIGKTPHISLIDTAAGTQDGILNE